MRRPGKAKPAQGSKDKRFRWKDMLLGMVAGFAISSFATLHHPLHLTGSSGAAAQQELEEGASGEEPAAVELAPEKPVAPERPVAPQPEPAPEQQLRSGVFESPASGAGAANFTPVALNPDAAVGHLKELYAPCYYTQWCELAVSRPPLVAPLPPGSSAPPEAWATIPPEWGRAYSREALVADVLSISL